MAVEYRLETFTGRTQDLVNLLNSTWAPQGYHLHSLVSRLPNSAGGYDFEVLLERERS